MVCAALGVREGGGGGGKYLGFRSIVGRKKKAIYFNFIKDKVWQKINSWRRRVQSMVVREVFVKSCTWKFYGQIWRTVREWDSRIYFSLIWPCYINKDGVLFSSQMLCHHVFSKPNTFLMEILWVHPLGTTYLLPGEVYYYLK